MKIVWTTMFIASLTLLVLVLLRNKLSWSGIRNFGLHLVLASALLYVLNYSGIIPDTYIPLNPYTIGTVVALGIPGIALIMGIQWVVL